MRQNARRAVTVQGLHLDGYNELPMGARPPLRHWRVIRSSASWPFPALHLTVRGTAGHQKFRFVRRRSRVLCCPGTARRMAHLGTANRSRGRVDAVNALTKRTLIDLLEGGSLRRMPERLAAVLLSPLRIGRQRVSDQGAYISMSTLYSEHVGSMRTTEHNSRMGRYIRKTRPYRILVPKHSVWLSSSGYRVRPSVQSRLPLPSAALVLGVHLRLPRSVRERRVE